MKKGMQTGDKFVFTINEKEEFRVAQQAGVHIICL